MLNGVLNYGFAWLKPMWSIGGGRGILVNLSDTEFVVNPGERIAQMILARYERFDWEVVEELDDTVRGEGGLGSTGIE